MTFQGIVQIKPGRKNQKILHIKLGLSKVVEYFENTLKAQLQIVSYKWIHFLFSL